MLFKSVKATIEAVDEVTGEFEAIVSAFGNIDSYGDVVVKGAFADTLAEWEKSGDPIPVYYSHRMDDPDYNIGYVKEAKEVDAGLYIKGQIDLDPGTKAMKVYRLLKGRRLTQFSFAYDVVEGGWEQRKSATGDDVEYFELRKLKLYEVGPTPVGANQDTELLGVKHIADSMQRRQKAGAVLSVRNKESLLAAKSAIDSVLANASVEPDDEKAQQASASAKDDETQRSKSDESKPSSTVTARLSILSILERE